MEAIRFNGSSQFRARLVLSILSGRPVRITGIRDMSEKPGITDEEASFIRLLDKLTNGTSIKINETGTNVSMNPGFIMGGKVEHSCPTSRAIGYFLESILPLCPFSKKAMSITFGGVTDNDVDIGIDTIQSVSLPTMARFAPELANAELKVVKRGCFPGGGGQVYFFCPIVRTGLKAVQLLDEGFVKRIRGVAFASNISPQVANRMVDSARGVLNNFIPDVYVHTDHRRGAEGAGAPGFGVSLVAESTTGCFYGTKRCAVRETTPEDPDEELYLRALQEYNDSRGIKTISHPEDLGLNVAQQLVEEIAKGGVVDTTTQWLVLLLMVLCPEDVSKVKFGRLSPYVVAFLRLIKQFFGVEFKIVEDSEAQRITLSCLGVGFKNLSRKVT